MNVGRNDLCPCGSGTKFKSCCLEPSFSNDNQKWFIDLKKWTRSSNLLIVLKNIEHLSIECSTNPTNFRGVLVGSWTLAFIAAQYIFNEEPSSNEVDESAFLEALKLSLNIPYPGIEKELESKQYRYSIRAAYLQNSYNEPIHRLWGRGLAFYKYYRDYYPMKEFDIQELFQTIYGLDVDTFFFLGMACSATTEENKDFNIADILNTREETFLPYVSKEKVQQFISALSIRPEDFRKSYAANYDKRSVEFTLNPLKSYPIIQFSEDTYAIPVIRLLLEKVFQGVFYDLNDHFAGRKNNPFRDYLSF